MAAFCELSSQRGFTNYFYGDTDETLALASERLRQKHHGLKIVGAYSPPFRELTPDEDARIVEVINQANPDVLWVALGLPKQERWIVAHRDRLKAPVIVAVGAAIKLLVSLAFLLPNTVSARLPVLPHAELALELAPALLGVGFILGYRQSGVLVAGSLVSSLVLIPLIAWIGSGLTVPLYPETQQLVSAMTTDDIWSHYVRYIGAGAVATAGLLTVLRGLPTMASAFAAVARGMRRARSRTPFHVGGARGRPGRRGRGTPAPARRRARGRRRTGRGAPGRSAWSRVRRPA
jgi:hypothetical protein